MATLAESFLADLEDQSDVEAEEPQQAGPAGEGDDEEVSGTWSCWLAFRLHMHCSWHCWGWADGRLTCSMRHTHTHLPPTLHSHLTNPQADGGR